VFVVIAGDIFEPGSNFAKPILKKYIRRAGSAMSKRNRLSRVEPLKPFSVLNAGSVTAVSGRLLTQGRCGANLCVWKNFAEGVAL